MNSKKDGIYFFKFFINSRNLFKINSKFLSDSQNSALSGKELEIDDKSKFFLDSLLSELLKIRIIYICLTNNSLLI